MHGVVTLRLYPEYLLVVGLDGHSARLERHFGRAQSIYDWQHYIASVERKPRALRNCAPFREVPSPWWSCNVAAQHPGGDRVIAQVLSALSPCPRARRQAQRPPSGLADIRPTSIGHTASRLPAPHNKFQKLG